MKTAKRLTEHLLIPLNLAFLSFFGLFLMYEFDQLVNPVPVERSNSTFLLVGVCTLFLSASFKIRNFYFQFFCLFLAVFTLVILT